MRIEIRGDLHGDFSSLYSVHPGTDLCLLTGDFGGVFDCSKEEQRKLIELEKLPFDIAFVEGNHDCIDALASMPLTCWNQGMVHRVASNIFH